MLAGRHQSACLQMSVSHNERTFTTKLLHRDEALDIVSGWANVFIEYYSAKFEDMIFLLT